MMCGVIIIVLVFVLIGTFMVWLRETVPSLISDKRKKTVAVQYTYFISHREQTQNIRNGSDVHCPMKTRVNMSNCLAVIGEECHNWHRIIFS